MNYFNLLLILVNALKVGTVEGIIGGIEVKHGSFKYIVSVQRESGHICGGTIIDEQHVLTAAHCVIERPNNSFVDKKLRVLGNVLNLQNAEEVQKGIWAVVDKAYVPADYKRGLAIEIADIAVLKLKEKLLLGKNFPLDKLSISLTKNMRYRLFLRKIGTVAGFGIDEPLNRENTLIRESMNDIHQISRNLKSIEVTIVRSDYCIKSISDVHVCAKVNQNHFEYFKGTCNGDTGSPLVVNENILVGILSQVRRDCNEKWSPAIYTKISEYILFIENAMNNVALPSIRVATYQDMHVLEIVTTFDALMKNVVPDQVPYRKHLE